MVWRVHVTQLAADVGIEAEDGATVNEDLCKDVEAGQRDRSVSYPFFSGYERDEAFPQDTDLSVCHEAHIYI